MTELIKLYILVSSGEKVIILSFADALTSLTKGSEMEEWTECEDHRNMILTRRYRKEENGSVSVYPLRQSNYDRVTTTE